MKRKALLWETDAYGLAERQGASSPANLGRAGHGRGHKTCLSPGPSRTVDNPKGAVAVDESDRKTCRRAGSRRPSAGDEGHLFRLFQSLPIFFSPSRVENYISSIFAIFLSVREYKAQVFSIDQKVDYLVLDGTESENQRYM